jgi:hypothetical protein
MKHRVKRTIGERRTLVIAYLAQKNPRARWGFLQRHGIRTDVIKRWVSDYHSGLYAACHANRYVVPKIEPETPDEPHPDNKPATPKQQPLELMPPENRTPGPILEPLKWVDLAIPNAHPADVFTTTIKLSLVELERIVADYLNRNVFTVPVAVNIGYVQTERLNQKTTDPVRRDSSFRLKIQKPTSEN